MRHCFACDEAVSVTVFFPLQALWRWPVSLLAVLRGIDGHVAVRDHDQLYPCVTHDVVV